MNKEQSEIMRPINKGRRTLRGHLAAAGVAGAAALIAATMMGGGSAWALGTGASTVTSPSQGAPHFNTDNASEPIRGSGSDTTFFVMQKISDIYNAAGLYGCTLTTASGQTLIDGSTTPSPLPTTNGQGTDQPSPSARTGQPMSPPLTTPTTGTGSRSPKG